MKERWVKMEHRLPSEAYVVSLEMYPSSMWTKTFWNVCDSGELCGGPLSPCHKNNTYAVFAGARIYAH